MSRVLAPAADLLEMRNVLAASQFLYQISLGYVQWMYVNARLLMCAVRSFSMLTLDRNIFVDIDVNPEGDVCSLMLAGRVTTTRACRSACRSSPRAFDLRPRA